MKSQFKAKLIQHLAGKRNSEEGFTLIELLVVIIIIGILAAIALPSFLNQAAKAKQSEASTYVGTLNRSQQAYYIENGNFAADLVALKAGVPEATTNYTYQSNGTETVADNIATPESVELKAFKGQVSVNTETQQAEASLCAEETAGGGAYKQSDDITADCKF